MTLHISEKKIVTDESMRPVAVQIPYQDWLEIERRLGIAPAEGRTRDLSRFEGLLELTEDPAVFQERLRGEWP